MKSGLLKLINTFVRVVEVGSFSAVAEETRSTQPTISRQINTLEDHLGVRLLHRTTRTLELTEEGQSYYTHAVEILASVDRASEAVSAGSSRVAGTLRIAGSVAFTLSLIHI